MTSRDKTKWRTVSATQMTLHDIPEMSQIGVKSLKIETVEFSKFSLRSDLCP